jgi:integrase
MSSRGNLQRKCIKGHPKAAGKCSSRCIRYYPRLELPRGPDGTRRFEALGGYPTRSHAEAALADALARRSHGFVLDPAKLTIDQYLDRWLAHIAPTGAPAPWPGTTRFSATTPDPTLAPRPLKQLTPLEIQAIYDRLAVGGRRDGKPGGLAPQHILAVHRCLHRALQQAVTWRLLARNPATHATLPPRPHRNVVALAPEQVAVLLDAADHTHSPWLGTWTMLAAATGARNGELCGLEWADLDLDAGTVRFHQALTIIDPAVLPIADPSASGRRKELAVGPVKSAASSAILTLPPFAVQALRQHRLKQARLRLACGQPPDGTDAMGRTRPAAPAGPAGPGVPHRAGHPGQPQPRQPRLRPPGRRRRAGRPPPPAAPRAGVGDGGQQGAGQHHRRPAPPCRRRRPRPAGLHPPASPDRIPGGRADRGRVRPGSTGWAGGVGGASGGGKPERNRSVEPGLIGRPAAAFPQLKGSVAGTGFEPV